MSQILRAQLTEDFKAHVPLAEQAYELAEQTLGAKAYVSLVMEKRWNRSFRLDPRSQNLDESKSLGWNLRAFDGRTMFERAGDVFTKEAFSTAIQSLNQEVQKLHQRYTPPSWSERLKTNLESEITSQVPKEAGPKTWVHFGTRMQVAVPTDNAQIMQRVKSEYEDIQKDLKNTPSADAPNFVQLLYRFAIEEFLFLDSSVRMSQSLVRPQRVVLAVKGEHQAHVSKGSLGGMEVIEPSSANLSAVMDRLGKLSRAQKIKPGRYKVLMAPSITGVFAHEAFGHSQEADTWMRGRSKAKDLYDTQQRVGNDFATITNNPAIFQNGPETTGAWGSYFFDEEGWLAQKQILVEKGYLRPPMTDLTSAFRLGVPRSANGKRESWSHGVYSRQTNTYFEPGQDTLNEILSKVDYGFLATSCFGGMEDPKGMGIQVGMQYLEEIRDGKLTGKTFVAPNGGAVQMTGYVPDYLNSILAVSKIDATSSGKDKSVHPWNEVGGCGKYHKEYVKAGCGGPYLLVDQVSLG